MVTDKTPPLKRILRAEQSATEWKIKAIERREEIEYLEKKFKLFEMQVAKFSELSETACDLKKQVDQLTKELHKANQTITSLQQELKKNVFKRI